MKGYLKMLRELAGRITYYAQWTGCDSHMAGNHEMAEVEYRARLWIGVYEFLVALVPNTLCHFKGHKWVVESDIGPDSGSEYFECTRCGFSHDITYY